MLRAAATCAKEAGGLAAWAEDEGRAEELAGEKEVAASAPCNVAMRRGFVTLIYIEKKQQLNHTRHHGRIVKRQLTCNFGLFFLAGTAAFKPPTRE